MASSEPSNFASSSPSDVLSDVPSIVPAPVVSSPTRAPARSSVRIPTLPPSRDDIKAMDSSGLSTGAIVGIVLAIIVGALLMMLGIWKLSAKRTESSRLQANENRTDTVAAQPSATTTTEPEPVLNAPVGPPLLNTQQPIIPPTTVTAHPVIDPPGHSNELINVAVGSHNRSVVDPPAQVDDYVVTYKDQSRSVIATTPMVRAFVRTPNVSNDASLLPIVTAVPYQPPPSNSET